MAKKMNYKQQRKQEARRNRMLLIGGVVALAVVIVVILILQIPQPSQPVGQFNAVPTQTWPQVDGKALGAANAPVLVQEFADYQCPYCKRFHDEVMSKIISDYVPGGKVRVEYHHFVVIDQNTGGTESQRAAEASECAVDQGRFWDYSNILFANQQAEASGAFKDNRLKAFAASLGLDTNKFNSCLDSGSTTARVNSDINMATAVYKLSSTPTLIIDRTVVANPLDYAAIQAAIDAAIKAHGQ